jgi:hypothetical protein
MPGQLAGGGKENRGHGLFQKIKFFTAKTQRARRRGKEKELILLRKTAFSLLLLSFFASFASLRCKFFHPATLAPGVRK